MIVAEGEDGAHNSTVRAVRIEGGTATTDINISDHLVATGVDTVKSRKGDITTAKNGEAASINTNSGDNGSKSVGTIDETTCLENPNAITDGIIHLSSSTLLGEHITTSG